MSHVDTTALGERIADLQHSSDQAASPSASSTYLRSPRGVFIGLFGQAEWDPSGPENPDNILHDTLACKYLDDLSTSIAAVTATPSASFSSFPSSVAEVVATEAEEASFGAGGAKSRPLWPSPDGRPNAVTDSATVHDARDQQSHYQKKGDQSLGDEEPSGSFAVVSSLLNAYHYVSNQLDTPGRFLCHLPPIIEQPATMVAELIAAAIQSYQEEHVDDGDAEEHQQNKKGEEQRQEGVTDVRDLDAEHVTRSEA